MKHTFGSVTVDDQLVVKLGPDRGMVFQQYSLQPCGGALANTFLSLVGLSKFADRYSSELSGGMQQRVGIAHSLAY